MFFNSDIVNFLLKAKPMGGETEGLTLLFWSTLIVAGRDMRWEGRKSRRVVRWEGGKVGEYWDGEVGGSSLYSRVGGGGGGGRDAG